MKNALKRTLAIFLTIVMTIGIAPLSGFVGLKFPEIKLPEWNFPDFSLKSEAEEVEYSGSCGTNVYWSLDIETGVLDITGTGAMKSYSSSNIPWYSYRSYIKTVNIADGVTSISSYAFYNYTSLVSVIVGNDVANIDYAAFYGCTDLKELVLPASSKICDSSSTFYNCTNIEKVTLTKGKGIMQDYGTSTTGYSVSTYYQYTPWYISQNTIKEIIIEDGVENIGMYSFYYCSGLDSIKIPDSVKSIGEKAFYCSSLVSVEIPDNVVSIGDSAFYGCSALESVRFGNNVTNIWSYAFYGCTSLKSITLPDNVKIISEYAFSDCTGLVTAILGNGVTNINYHAFYNCVGLKYLTMPVSAKIYNNQTVFYGCNNIERVTLTKGTGLMKDYGTETSKYTPWYMSGNTIKEIIIEDGVTDIGTYAFYECTSLEIITIPDSVTYIGSSAFYGCTNLSDVYYGGTETQWNAIKFNYSNSCLTDANIHFGHNHNYVGSIVKDATCVEEGIERYVCSCGDSYDVKMPIMNHTKGEWEIAAEPTEYNEGKKVLHCAFCETIIDQKVIFINKPIKASGECGNNNELIWVLYADGTFNIMPSGMESDAMFDYSHSILTAWNSYNSYIKNVNIRDGVTHVGNYSFYGCENLTTVTIAGTVESIGENAFYNCVKLKNVTIDEGVREIGSGAFGCTSLYRNELESIVIPDSVLSIGNCAFFYCENLREITMPVSAKIYNTDGTFKNCFNIEKITLTKGTGEMQNYGTDTYYSATDTCYGYTPWYISRKSLKEIVIEEGVEHIGSYAFAHNPGIISITIPDSVKTIGRSAFFNCTNLTTLVLGKGVEEAGTSVFGLCKKLKSVTIPASLKTLSNSIFEYCDSLESVTLYNTTEEVKANAFLYCKNFTDIYFYGTEDEWLNVTTIEIGNNYFINANVHFLKNIVDEDTDVEIEHEDDVYEDGTDVDAVVIPDDGQIMLTNDHKKKTNAVIYDISTIKDNMVVQPNGKVKVSIPAPKGYKNSKIFVFHIDNTINGREWIPARIINGYVVFEVTHFSYYAVADLDFTFSLNKSEATLTNKNKTVKLSPMIDSEIAISGYTVQWLSNDETVATVDENGVVTRVGNGECTITAIFNEDTTKLAQCKITSVDEGETNVVDLFNTLRGTASIKTYKGEEYVAITMASGKTMTGLYKDMVDGGTVELVDIVGTIQDRAGDYVAYQSQNKTNPVATMKVTYADGTVETYPVVFELYEMEREIDLDISKNIRPIRGTASLAEDAKGEYILVEMLEGQSSVGVYKATADGSATATLDGAEGMFTEQEKLYIFYGSQNTFNPEGRLTVTEADESIKTYRVVFKMYEMDPYVNVAKGLRPVRGAVTFDDDGTIRVKMTKGQTSVGLYKTMANGATFKIVDANGKITNNPSSLMFYMSANPANVTAKIIFTLPDSTTKEQKIIFDMGLASDPDPLLYLTAVRGTVSYQNDGEDYIEVKANEGSTGVGLYKDCLVKYTITDVDGVMTENDSRYYIYKSQNPDGVTANINFLQSDGSYKTYKVKFVF